MSNKRYELKDCFRWIVLNGEKELQILSLRTELDGTVTEEWTTVPVFLTLTGA